MYIRPMATLHPAKGGMEVLHHHSLGTQKEVPYVTLLPSASGQQAAVLCQGGGLLHSVPDPGGIVEPVRGGQQSEHGP